MIAKIRSSVAAFAAVWLALGYASATRGQTDPLSVDNPYVRPGSPSLILAGEPYTIGGVPGNFSQLMASGSFDYNFNGANDGAFFGNVLSFVYRDPGTGFLAFAYKFNNLDTGSPPKDIDYVTIGDATRPFNGFTIYAGGSDGSGSSTPVGTNHWSNGDPDMIAYGVDGNGLRVTFDSLAPPYGTQLRSTSNDTSALFWVATDARNWQVTNVGLSDTSYVGTAHAFAPAPVPEPSTVVLFSVAVAVILLSRGGLQKV